MADFNMPSLGADMESGVLLEWKVEPGDSVSRGDIVALVDTSKAEIEIEVFEDGIVDELLVPVGERVPVGTPIARIRGDRTEPAPATASAPAPPPVVEGQPAPAPAPPAAAESRPPIGPAWTPAPLAHALPRATPGADAPPLAFGRQHVSPVARRMAAAMGVDLATIRGTGPHGAVVKADVERAVGAPPSANGAAAGRAERAPGHSDRASTMRASIAHLMARSNREIPHYYLGEEIDMAAALAFLQRHNESVPIGVRVLPAALLVKAVAASLRDSPELNGFWTEDAFHRGTGVHVGFAVALRGGGLIAPAIHDADGIALPELMQRMRDLVRRARAGTLRSAEVSDATVTITNLGENGVQEVYGVIQPPQVALVGFGRICERPWAQDGMVGARPTVRATLSADHRATDGYSGGRFLASLAARLQRPEEL